MMKNKRNCGYDAAVSFFIHSPSLLPFGSAIAEHGTEVNGRTACGEPVLLLTSVPCSNTPQTRINTGFLWNKHFVPSGLTFVPSLTFVPKSNILSHSHIKQ